MNLPNYYLDALVSVIIGLISSIVFDFFRSLRKLKKTKNYVVMIQDIIYFIIIFLVIITAMYLFLDDRIRIYMIACILISSFIYFKYISKYIIAAYIFILKKLHSVFNFIFITITLHFEFFKKIAKNIHKFVKLCCIKNLNMIIYIWNKLKQNTCMKQKKKVENEK